MSIFPNWIVRRVKLFRDLLLVEQSILFDPDWYRESYCEADRQISNAVLDYLVVGWRVGRDPGPGFETDWYLRVYPNVLAWGVNPLLHYLRGGYVDGMLPSPATLGKPDPPYVSASLVRKLFLTLLRAIRVLPVLCTALPKEPETPVNRIRSQVRKTAGGSLRKPENPTILVCGHASGPRLFGAERSLIDVVKGLDALMFNVVITLPAPNREYERLVLPYCVSLYVFSYPVWEAGLPEQHETVDKFCSICAEENIDVVHANTILLREPLTAAKQLSKVRVIHARELISCNAELQRAIGLPADDIVALVTRRSDFLIANSEATKACYRESTSAHVVCNPVNPPINDARSNIDVHKVRFGMVGNLSNGKGIDDFIQLARSCEQECIEAEFIAIGPEPSWSGRQSDKLGVDSNVTFTGYVPSTDEAIRQIDVLLSLSRIPESFGRTVAEAMACGRAVIAYAHGAIPELVVDGVTGFLVAPGDMEALKRAVKLLSLDPNRVEEYGKKGRERVNACFSREGFLSQLDDVYQEVTLRVG